MRMNMKRFIKFLSAIPNCILVLITFGKVEIIVKDVVGDGQRPKISLHSTECNDGDS